MRETAEREIQKNSEMQEENKNEHKAEQKNIETIMKDIQVQPRWQYEDNITMSSETAVKETVNKQLSQYNGLANNPLMRSTSAVLQLNNHIK
eukprot:969719-Amphidinium_carterae.2